MRGGLASCRTTLMSSTSLPISPWQVVCRSSFAPNPSNRIQSQLKVARVWGFSETNNAATASSVYYQVLNSSGQYFNFDSNTGRSEQLDS